MSESFMPPVMVELGGNAAGFLKTLTKAITTLERFAAAAKTAAATSEKAFATIEAAAAPVAAMAESVAAAKKEMQGLSRASNAVAKATDKAAVSANAGMTSIGVSAERMAERVGAATTTSAAGIASIGAGSRATAAGLRATSTSSAAAGASMARSGEQAEGMGMKLLGLGPIFDKVKKWGTLGLAAVGIASVVLATHFQTEMTRISTAAGAPAAQVEAMRNEVLKTATSVGESGTKMAEALYHPVSAGLSLKTSLAAVKYAAEEAQISGASLDDTTYSLSSVMKAFNFSAAQAGPTMSQLNAIVGEGDMRFQDFNQSVKNWAPTAAQMGMSVTSMGSGLAYLTDRGNSAEVAATRMTMGISMMTTPSSKATKMLVALGDASTDVHASSQAMQKAMEASGVTQNRLAEDLKKPDGLYVALNDLKTSLQKAGVSGTEADSVLSKIFGGGRSDKAILSLMQNLGGLKDKYDAITRDSSMEHFNAAWEKTTKTMRYQFEQIKAGAENLGIRLGNALIPQVEKFINLVEKRGAPAAKAISSAFAGITSGFTGNTDKGAKEGRTITTAGGQQHGGAVAAAPSLTGWQKAGQAIKQVTDNVKTFARQASVAFGNLARSLEPTIKLLGELGMGALMGVARTLTTVVGPALQSVTGFMERHKGIVEAVVLALLMYKGMIIATTVVTKTIAIATKAWAVAEAILNGVMEVNPFVLILVGIALLVAGIIYAYKHFAWFRAAIKATVDFVKAYWLPIVAIIAGPIGLVVGLIIKYWSQISGAVMTAVNWTVGFVQSHWPLLLAILTGPIGLAVWAIVHYWGKISSGFSSAYQATVALGRSMVNWVTGLPGRILGALSSLGGKLSSWSSSAWSRAKSAAVAKANEMLAWVKGLPGRINSSLGNLGRLLYASGQALIRGFVSGITSMASAAKNAVSGVLSSVRNYLPFSPAKEGPFSGRGWTLYSGQALVQGLADGITSKSAAATSSIRGVAVATQSAFATEMEINSPSRKFVALGAYVMDGLISGLTGSTARVRAATEHIARALYTNFGSSHKGLQKYVTRENAALMALAKNRDTVAGKLKAAQSRLAALQKSWASEQASVAASIMQSASIITTSPDEGRAVNAADVVAQMQQKLQAATTFAANLKQLQKEGLRSDLIQQLAAAGVDQGGATALALAAGSKGQIQQMNAMQASLSAAANSTGSAVADSMYGAGIKSAQGLVKGLQSQEKQIEAQMMRIAKAMQTAIKRALGIRSPSAVMARLGDYTAQGMAVGIHRSGKQAAIAAKGMAMSVAQSAALRPGAMGFGMNGAPGGGAVVHNHYHVNVEGSVTTERKLIEVVRTGVLQGARRNPNNGLSL